MDLKPSKFLTLAQLRQLRDFTDSRDADTLAIVMSCECTKQEAEEFFDNSPAGDVLALLEAIFELSGLGQGAQFQGGQADVPRAT